MFGRRKISNELAGKIRARLAKARADEGGLDAWVNDTKVTLTGDGVPSARGALMGQLAAGGRAALGDMLGMVRNPFGSFRGPTAG